MTTLAVTPDDGLRLTQLAREFHAQEAVVIPTHPAASLAIGASTLSPAMRVMPPYKCAGLDPGQRNPNRTSADCASWWLEYVHGVRSKRPDPIRPARETRHENRNSLQTRRGLH